MEIELRHGDLLITGECSCLLTIHFLAPRAFYHDTGPVTILCWTHDAIGLLLSTTLFGWERTTKILHRSGFWVGRGCLSAVADPCRAGLVGYGRYSTASIPAHPEGSPYLFWSPILSCCPHRMEPMDCARTKVSPRKPLESQGYAVRVSC